MTKPLELTPWERRIRPPRYVTIAAKAGSARLRHNRPTKKQYRRKSRAEGATFVGEVADGTRTHDHLDHNQGLYQLSYSHRALPRIAAFSPRKVRSTFLGSNQGLYQLSYSHRAQFRIAALLPKKR